MDESVVVTEGAAWLASGYEPRKTFPILVISPTEQVWEVAQLVKEAELEANPVVMFNELPWFKLKVEGRTVMLPEDPTIEVRHDGVDPQDPLGLAQTRLPV